MKTLAPPKAPAMPRDIADTGIPQPMLLGLMLKLMQIEAMETVADLARAMCLPYQIVRRLMDDAGQRKQVEALGASTGGVIAEIRYTLSQAGRTAAGDARRARGCTWARLPSRSPPTRRRCRSKPSPMNA